MQTLWFQDINECDKMNDTCDKKISTCHNLPGSYKCICNIGYQNIDDFICAGELEYFVSFYHSIIFLH